MRVLILGMMGPGTLEAKILPISKLQQVDKIIFIRKAKGPKIQKLSYVTLPNICKYSIFNLIITPIIAFKVILTNRPNLIMGYHVIPYGFMVSFLGLITSTPYIVAQTGLQIQEKVKQNKIVRFILKEVFKLSFTVFCPGSSSVKFWSSIYPITIKKHIVLHSCIDIKVYKPLITNNIHYDFIFLGRLHKIKNVDLIIQSLYLLNKKYTLNCKLQIVGDGPEYAYLLQLVEDLHLSNVVHFKGFVPDPVIYLNNSNFIIMASSSEGLPTALMQGMACSLIPITNIVGNISDVVKEDISGYTFKQLDKQILADVMFKAITTNGEILKSIKDNARNLIITNHSLESAMKKWSQCLTKLDDYK